MGSQGSLAVGNYCLIAFHVSSFIQAKLIDDLRAYFADGGSGYIILSGDLRLAFWLPVDHCQVALGAYGGATIVGILQCL